MRHVNVTIEGLSAYSQSRYIGEIPAEGKETKEDREKRIWKERVHVNDEGGTYIPPMALKKCLEEAAPYLGKIPGQGNATYTKRFRSGVMVFDPCPLFNGRSKKQATLDSWHGEWLFLDANGKPGGTRVKRCMPFISPWKATATIHVLDEVVTEDVLRKCFEDAGNQVGIGRFRPANGGYYGRFRLVDMEWI